MLPRLKLSLLSLISSLFPCCAFLFFFFFFNDTATTEIYTLSLHDALPILHRPAGRERHVDPRVAQHGRTDRGAHAVVAAVDRGEWRARARAGEGLHVRAVVEEQAGGAITQSRGTQPQAGATRLSPGPGLDAVAHPAG